MDKKKQKAIDKLETRWNNMSRIMQSLVTEFNMFKAAHESIIRDYYEDTTSNKNNSGIKE